MAPDAAAAEREGRAKKRQFEAVRTLGRGTSGTVKLCRFKPTGALVALKSLVKAHTDGTGAESFWREVTALRTAGRHENLCGLLDAFETSTKYYLVLEYCSGGDLFNRLASGGVFTEAHAATSVATILNALHFLHSHGVVHRDLKPANLLMRDSSLNAALVLVDFGSSFVGTGVQASGGKDAMQTLAGTPYYLAPEIVRGKRYSSKCDLWSTGCIAYELLAGCTPFHYASSIQDLYKRIRRADFSFPPECGSDLARDFVCRLLDPDPRARPTALEALGHPWIRTYVPSYYLMLLALFNHEADPKMFGPPPANATDALFEVSDSGVSMERMSVAEPLRQKWEDIGRPGPLQVPVVDVPDTFVADISSAALPVDPARARREAEERMLVALEQSGFVWTGQMAAGVEQSVLDRLVEKSGFVWSSGFGDSLPDEHEHGSGDEDSGGPGDAGGPGGPDTDGVSRVGSDSTADAVSRIGSDTTADGISRIGSDSTRVERRIVRTGTESTIAASAVDESETDTIRRHRKGEKHGHARAITVDSMVSEFAAFGLGRERREGSSSS